jgi:hypothetical protein
VIWRKDAARICREAAEIVEDVAVNEQRCVLAMNLRQLAIVLDAPPPVVVPPGAVSPGALAGDAGRVEFYPSQAVPANEYEKSHREKAAFFLCDAIVAPATDRQRREVRAEQVVTHIVEAAAHRVMSQVIGAIEKVNADRATPTGEASASQRGDRHRGRAGGRGKRPRAQKGARKAGRR